MWGAGAWAPRWGRVLLFGAQDAANTQYGALARQEARPRRSGERAPDIGERKLAPARITPLLSSTPQLPASETTFPYGLLQYRKVDETHDLLYGFMKHATEKRSTTSHNPPISISNRESSHAVVRLRGYVDGRARQESRRHAARPPGP